MFVCVHQDACVLYVRCVGLCCVVLIVFMNLSHKMMMRSLLRRRSEVRSKKVAQTRARKKKAKPRKSNTIGFDKNNQESKQSD